MITAEQADQIARAINPKAERVDNPYPYAVPNDNELYYTNPPGRLWVGGTNYLAVNLDTGNVRYFIFGE